MQHSPSYEWVVVVKQPDVVISCDCICGDPDCGWTGAVYPSEIYNDTTNWSLRTTLKEAQSMANFKAEENEAA